MDLDEFTRAYIECALWSSTPSFVCFCEHDLTSHANLGQDMDEIRGACSECDCKAYQQGDASYQNLGYGEEDIHPDTLLAIAEDCQGFQEANAEHLETVYGEWSEDDPGNYGPEQAGHDYWLTRNGHGAGFWDRYYGANQDIVNAFKALTESAGYHTVDLTLGDDGKVY